MKTSETGVGLKFFVIFLSVSLFMGLTPLLGAAITPNDVPNNAIHIKNAKQLADIGGEQSEGKYYVLDNDINLYTENHRVYNKRCW